MRFEGFVGETYQARSPNANAERCVNLMPEMTGGAGKSKIHYLHTPGLEDFFTIPGGGPVRCLWAGEDRLFAISGTAYGEITNVAETPAWVSGGTVLDDGRRASIFAEATGSQLVIYSGQKLYCDSGSGPVIPANLPTYIASATYLDGYFLALERDSNYVWMSALLDGTSWSALDKQAKLSSADRLVALAAARRLLWLFGKRNIDVWYNSGNRNFPFEPVQGGNIPCGTVLPDTIESIDSALLFAAENDLGGTSVFRTEGFSLRPISTYAIDRFLSLADSPNAFRSWSYSEGGHVFYVLTTDVVGQDYSRTFVYDVRVGLWHERARWYASAFDPHLAQCHAYTTPGYAGGQGVHYVGSRIDGKVYRQSMDLYQDAGVGTRRYRQAPHLAAGAGPVFHHALHLDMTPQDTSATKLKYSNDDGATWSSERAPSVTPATADKSQKLSWVRLGSSWDRIYGLSVTDLNAPVAINDAFLEVTKGAGT